MVQNCLRRFKIFLNGNGKMNRKTREFNVYDVKNKKNLLMSFAFFPTYVTKIRFIDGKKDIKYLDIPHAKAIIDKLLISIFPDIEYEDVTYPIRRKTMLERLQNGEKIQKGGLKNGK